ncbi:hypothetical protein GH714_037588 [Hevea brasiliensis]|uniref:Uncharacterized protein n=1 Tax=Hevea brasiliensis TaxID=3981 RepID=A0A6A6MMM8_HEVBR|nr:hypothetical protein GH714_037588 [Hevea brasiliensis]
MEEELNGVLPCSSLAVDSILRVGTVGYGLMHRSVRCTQKRQSQSENSAFNVVNALIAGAMAGAAVAAGTRSWTQVVGMAGVVSAFSVAADYSKTV